MLGMSGIQIMRWTLISRSQLAMFVIFSTHWGFQLTTFQVISMYVNATTTTSGSATIENLTTGQTVSTLSTTFRPLSVSLPSRTSDSRQATKSLTSTSALGGQNAEWIVEDFEEGDSLIAFADFGNVTFTDCVAATSESSEGVSTATIMDIENTSDEVLTDTNVISDSSFMVSYTSSSSSARTSGTSGTGTGPGSGNGGGNGGKGGGHNGGNGNSAAAGAFGIFKRWMMLSEI